MKILKNYEKYIGSLVENAANISVRGRGVLNKITEALATYDKLSEVKE